MNDQGEDELRTIVLSIGTATGLSVLGVLIAVAAGMA